MIISQLIVLKNKSGLNNKQISERSTVPYSTVQKIFNEEIQSPSVDHVFKIVTAMGYTMNDLYPNNKSEGEDGMAVTVIREMYENRIADLKEQHKNAMDQSCSQYEKHIADIKEAKTKHGKTYKAVITILSGIIGVLFFLFIIYFAMDFSTGDWGIFFRD